MSASTEPGRERVVLHDFVTRYREDVIARTRQKLHARPAHADLPPGLEHGVPLFLTQLARTLRHESSDTPFPTNEIGDAAATHGGELQSLGFSVSEVVHTYGDICQAVTELAVERDVAISTQEFHTLNRCLDTAIAEAVTEHARLSAEWNSSGEVERVGQLAHEIRNHLNSAMLAFESLKRGTVAINGSTGAVLGRSLLAVRQVVDSTLADVRLTALPQHRERVRLAAFLGDVAVAAAMHAEYRGVGFTLARISPDLFVDADPHVLGSAVSNLLGNAFKFTREGGNVLLGATGVDDTIHVTIQDECGGMPNGTTDPFRPFGERRGKDRTGLGLGLSIARKAVRAHGGDITITDVPGHGCVFTIALPVATAEAAV